jgi:hypothetical protein
MNNNIQCPFCDNNIIVNKMQGKTKVTCPVCNSSFEYKLFSKDSEKDSQTGISAYYKKYKQPLSIVIILALLGISLFFYNSYESNNKNEQNIKEIHKFITKVHPERRFSEIEVRKSIADSLGIPHYMSDTDKTIDEVTASVGQEIEVLLSKKYPDKSIGDFKSTAKNELGFVMDHPDLNIEDLDSLVEHEIEKGMKVLNSQTVNFDEESELKRIATELKVKFPIEAPQKNISECEKLINDKIEQEVSETIGKSRNDKIKELMQKYKPYKDGDYITVKSSSLGAVAGKYCGKDGVFLKIGETKIPISDIRGYSDEPRFDENQCDKIRNEEMLLINKKYNEAKIAMIAKLKTNKNKSVFEENGYIYCNDKWVSVKNMAHEMLENKRKLIAEGAKEQRTTRNLISKDCKNRIYRQHGYALSDDNLTPVNILIGKKASELLEKYKENNSIKKERLKKDLVNDLYSKNGYVKYNEQLVPGKKILDKLVAEKNYPLLLDNEYKIALENIPVDKTLTLPNTDKTSANDLFMRGQKQYELLNYEKALPLIYAAALKGHAKATQLLAGCYKNGNFVRQDPEMAFKLSIKAAVLDNSLASDRIVEAYKNGQGVQKSTDFAADWLAFIENSSAGHVKPTSTP